MASKPIHYSPSGQRPLCKCGKSPVEMGYTSSTWLTECRRSSTDICRVTCADCLHLLAAMLERKGVPVVIKPEGHEHLRRFLAK
jgi:hypothetical protein